MHVCVRIILLSLLPPEPTGEGCAGRVCRHQSEERKTLGFASTAAARWRSCGRISQATQTQQNIHPTAPQPNVFVGVCTNITMNIYVGSNHFHTVPETLRNNAQHLRHMISPNETRNGCLPYFCVCRRTLWALPNRLVARLERRL